VLDKIKCTYPDCIDCHELRTKTFKDKDSLKKFLKSFSCKLNVTYLKAIRVEGEITLFWCRAKKKFFMKPVANLRHKLGSENYAKIYKYKPKERSGRVSWGEEL